MHQPPTTFQVNGAAIREIRKAAGVETSQLAERAGISRRYLSHLENGTRSHMRPGPFARLRQALGAAEYDLLAPPEVPPPKE
ncbi:helix-turn-helix domain-containing protein [Streptomyces sp. NPDC057557]|uniref:helix-turn-helix domain-containing protein n=1 Tax=Streptomyces sp. NPDC057557 TaxID=3346167 RepID=UPI003690C4EF